MLIPQPGGTFTVTTEIALSPVFYSWIISFGSRRKFLAPQRAIDSCGPARKPGPTGRRR